MRWRKGKQKEVSHAEKKNELQRKGLARYQLNGHKQWKVRKRALWKSEVTEKKKTKHFLSRMLQPLQGLWLQS